MTGTKSPEYRDLERESSNQLMDHDAHRAAGRRDEATHCLLLAGEGRMRMGQIALEANEFAAAAEDWLSAAECFLDAAAAEQAFAAVDALRGLEANGKFPPARPDLAQTLRQRETRLAQLGQWLQRAGAAAPR